MEGALIMGGMRALGAGLYSMGIPKNSILPYETALSADKSDVITHGTAAEASRAREIISRTSPESVEGVPDFVRQHIGAGHL